MTIASIFAVFLSVNGQDITFCTDSGGLVEFIPSECETDFKYSIGEFKDMTYHPSGKLYGIKLNGGLYEIEVESGETTWLTDLPGEAFSSLTCNSLGHIFAASLMGDLVKYVPSANEYTSYENTGFGASGDLTFFQGEMYMVTVDNQVVRLTPGNSNTHEVFMDIPITNENVWGIVSYSDGCNTQTFLTTGGGESRIYELDWLTKTVSLVCELEDEVYGGASSYEFLASETPFQVSDIQVEQVSCNPDVFQVTVQAEAQNGGVQYRIDNAPFQASNVLTFEGAGQHTLFLTDETGCSYFRHFEAESNAIKIISEELLHSDCSGNLGSILLEAEGDGDLTYSLNGATPQASSTFTNLLAGNYTVLIQTQTGCERMLEFEIQAPESALDIDAFDFSVSHTTCGRDNGEVQINASSARPGHSNSFTYSVNGLPFSKERRFDFLSAGFHELSVRDETGCISKFFIEIEDSPELEWVEPIISPTTCPGLDGGITLRTEGEHSFTVDYYLNNEWLNNGIGNDIPLGKYMATASIPGCELEPLEIIMFDSCDIFIPNIFSPDDDGYNDVFKIFTSENLFVSDVSVFDRWGSLIYYSNNINAQENSGWWNGYSDNNEPAPEGVYVYLITIERPNGNLILKGDITLSR